MYLLSRSLVLLASSLIILDVAAGLQWPSSTHSKSNTISDQRWQAYRDRVARVEAVVKPDFARVDARRADVQQFRADPFDCPPLPARNRTTTSVHSLHPQDVKVVMAMGDSITAAFGAMGTQGLRHDLLEWRGWSFSIGGADNASTIAKHLKHYNADLTGMSYGDHIWEFCWGLICPERRHPELDQLNAAQSFSMMYNIDNGPGNQVKYLMEQLQSNPKIDFENDWKVLTIYQGSNDICAGCSNTTTWQPVSPQQYRQYFRQSLISLRDNIPRLFVNVVLLMHVSVVHNATEHSEYCRSMHESIFEWECSCAFQNTPEGRAKRQKMDNLTVEYNRALTEVVAEMSEERSESFAAVLQPGFTKPVNGTFPVTFLSTIDCFHPSLEAHIAMSKVLWNNMLTVKAEKSSNFPYHEPFICPTADTVFPTN